MPYSAKFPHTLGVVFATALLAAPVLAETPVGTWLTGPDKKGQVAHVAVKSCGTAFCGTVARTYDRAGKLIKGPNDGKRVLWDLTPQQGRYDGKILLPAYNSTVNGQIYVKGNALTVKGCLGPICKSQNWTRVN